MVTSNLGTMEFVKPPEEFAFGEPNAPQRWARWEKQFEPYFTAAELSNKSKEVQVDCLLNAAGAEAQELYELFTPSLRMLTGKTTKRF